MNWDWFTIMFDEGMDHILQWGGVDHILFIVALTAIFQLKHWGRVLGLVTFFTVGHTLTIILANMDLIPVNKAIAEFLIQVTIFYTGMMNLMRAGQNPRSNARFFLAALVGLIHGLGFFEKFRMLSMGDDKDWAALIPFSLGIEFAQIIVAVCVLLITAILFNFMRVKQREWNLFSSGIVCGVSAYLMVENWPW